MADKKYDFVADNGAGYNLVGKCPVCGMDLYHCETHPLRDERMDKTQAAVFVPNAMAEQSSTVYCLRHDPNIGHKMKRGLRPGEFMLGDIWEPRK